MFYINVYGFRNKIKKQKIFQILHSVVFGKKLLSHFCMHAIHPDVDPNLNVVTITFIKKKEADKAINLINGFVYFDFHSQSDLHLSAVDVTEQYRDAYVDSDDQIARDKEVRRTSRSQRPRESQGRSRSPHLAAEITKIDMEIELIQKERILIVEQRKLLLEKKRLELLKEFEPTSINDLERYVAAIERQDDDEPQNVPHKHVKVKCTPVPVLASRAIVKQMKDVLAKRENIRGIVTQPLCFTLKKRIIEIMKGKSNLDTDDIIKMYREVYPIESDEVLLDRLEAQINITQAFKNEMQKDFQVVKSDISGPSNTDKGEVNNKTEETKTKESENKEITSTEILDNELDDWLEDDKVNQQDGNNVDEKDTIQSVEVNDKELDK